MTQVDLLRHVVGTLEEAQIEYMITGSIASSLQGEPRATHDLDVAVAIQETDVGAVLGAFPVPRFYLDEEAIRNAIRNQEMFKVIDITEGDKVDFWMLTHEPFGHSWFARRVREAGGGDRLCGVEPRGHDTGEAALVTAGG